MNTAPIEKKRIAVIGATGHQGSAVVHACGPPASSSYALLLAIPAPIGGRPTKWSAQT